MTTSYPGAVDSLTNPTGTDQLSSPSHAGQHANANDAIEAIETELGTDPAGAEFATVDERIEDLEKVTGRKIWNNGSQVVTTSTQTKATGWTNSSIVGRGVTYNGGRNTLIIDQDGVYLVVLTARFNSVVAGKRVSLGVYWANNADPGTGVTPDARYTAIASGAGSTANIYHTATFVIPFTALDNVAMNFWHENGSNLTVDQFTMSIFRLGTV